VRWNCCWKKSSQIRPFWRDRWKKIDSPEPRGSRIRWREVVISDQCPGKKDRLLSCQNSCSKVGQNESRPCIGYLGRPIITGCFSVYRTGGHHVWTMAQQSEAFNMGVIHSQRDFLETMVTELLPEENRRGKSTSSKHTAPSLASSARPHFPPTAKFGWAKGSLSGRTSRRVQGRLCTARKMPTVQEHCKVTTIQVQVQETPNRAWT